MRYSQLLCFLLSTTILCHVLEKFGYKRDDIVVLTDDQQDPRSIPTRNNMVGLLLKGHSFLPYTHSVVDGDAMVSHGRAAK